MTRGQWAFAVLCVLLLVALPVGITLARGDRFESRVQLTTIAGQSEAQRVPTPTDLETYVSRLALRERVTRTASRKVGFTLDRAAVAERTRVAPGNSPNSVFIVASETTPERAKELAEVVAGLVVIEPRRDSEDRLRAELARLLDGASAPGLSEAEHESIDARVDEVALELREGSGSQPTLHEGGASAPAITAPVDKLANWFPGELPPRPSPVWVGLAGLLLAVAILSAWLILRGALADLAVSGGPALSRRWKRGA